MDGVVIGRSDIALLAQGAPAARVDVARPGCAGRVPFPAPLPDAGPPDLFDGAQVVNWPRDHRTGRNPDARADLAALPAFSADAPRTDPAVLAGLTALLCLLVVVGELPVDHDELLQTWQTRPTPGGWRR